LDSTGGIVNSCNALIVYKREAMCTYFEEYRDIQGYDNIKLSNNIEFALLASKQDLAKQKIFSANKLAISSKIKFC
jgi:hypothetical protein